MSVIDEVKERLDIVDVISSYVPLKKAGRNFKGLCPFHSEKTPSFIVFPDTQTWHCFGACNTGGDLFGFVMRRENVEFGEALRILAQRAGVSLQARGPAEAAEGKQKDRLRQLNSLAAQYFHYLLLNSPEAGGAREYLHQRGISDETRQAFQLGFARQDWNALGQHLTAKGYAWSDLLEAGLVLERQGGGYYDRFRGRLVFPIRDVRGDVVGFGARALDDSLPKYLNSPQTPLFDKSGILYGIDLARTAIHQSGFVVIVEGYMDVLMAHQHGRKNVVASMGTALTEKQIRIIKKLTKKLVLALDSDSAGDQATLRGMEIAADTFDRKAVPVPTWRGWIRYEEQLDAEIRVTALPSGQDPDEVIRGDLATWDALVSQALPVVEYYLQSVISRFDLSSPKEKVAAAREVLPVIRDIGSAVERSHYLQRLAHLLRIDERALERELQSGKAARRESGGPAERYGRLSAQPGLTCGLESYVLVLLIKRPDLLSTMNAALSGAGLEPLAGEDLSGVEERALFEWLAARVSGGGQVSAEVLQEEADAPLQPVLQRLLTLMGEVSFLPDEQVELDASRCALRLREERLRRRNEELRYLQEDARAQGDAEATRQWARVVDELALQLVRLQRCIVTQSSWRSLREEPLQS